MTQWTGLAKTGRHLELVAPSPAITKAIPPGGERIPVVGIGTRD